MEHNLDKLKERLLPLYVNLRKDCNADENLCPFLMQWGDKFPIRENDGIIFYGRATNGWSHGTWDDDIFFSNDDNSNERGWNRDDQMQWVENQWSSSEDGYNTNRSQFWNIIKGVSTHFYGQEWFNFVAWSNICKVAPYTQGNPSYELFEKTSNNNIEVLKSELGFWSPKYIVFLTDGMKRGNKTRISWWTDPFISSLLSDDDGKEPLPFCEVPWDKENPEIKIQVYKLREKYIIRSLHPQGRKVAPHKDAIINLIEMIEKGTQPGKCSQQPL